jgi:hypothetical protein
VTQGEAWTSSRRSSWRPFASIASSASSARIASIAPRRARASPRPPQPPRTASEAPAELLAALKRDLLAKLPAPAVAALTRELDAALAGGPSAPSAARLVQRFQEIEDVLEALYLSSAPAPGAE